MGDYWTVSTGVANHTGHTCRECRGIIYVNSPIYVRDGRKIRLFYHEACFSGDSDPRTQNRSSANERWEGISPQAPKGKGYGKWWTSSYGYSGGPPSTRSVSSPSGARHEIQALKEPTGNRIKQRRGNSLVVSPNDGGPSSSGADEVSNRRASCPEGISWKNMILKDEDTDDVNLLDPQESSGMQKSSNK